MILNSHLPIEAWRDPQTARLPGVRPVAAKDWLTCSDTYDSQMAYRRKLLQEKREACFVARDAAREACEELRDIIVSEQAVSGLDNETLFGSDHPLIDAALNVQ